MTNSYFVFFKTQRAAAAAAQCSIFPEGAQDAFQVFGAPGPEEVSLLPLYLALSLQQDMHFAAMASPQVVRATGVEELGIGLLVSVHRLCHALQVSDLKQLRSLWHTRRMTLAAALSELKRSAFADARLDECADVC